MTEGQAVPRETRPRPDRGIAEKVREAVSEAVSTVGAGVLGAGEVIYGDGGGMTPIAEEAARAARVAGHARAAVGGCTDRDVQGAAEQGR